MSTDKRIQKDEGVLRVTRDEFLKRQAGRFEMMITMWSYMEGFLVVAGELFGVAPIVLGILSLYYGHEDYTPFIVGASGFGTMCRVLAQFSKGKTLSNEKLLNELFIEDGDKPLPEMADDLSNLPEEMDQINKANSETEALIKK